MTKNKIQNIHISKKVGELLQNTMTVPDFLKELVNIIEENSDGVPLDKVYINLGITRHYDDNDAESILELTYDRPPTELEIAEEKMQKERVKAFKMQSFLKLKEELGL